MRYIKSYAAAVVLSVLAACTTIHPVTAESLPGISDQDLVDELAQSKSDLIIAQGAIDGFVAQTAQGKNLSDMTLGLYISNLLGQLGGQDIPLTSHLHQGGIFIEGYLKEIFQYHPRQEIAFIKAMSEPGNIQARQTAAAALECLRHIPNQTAPAPDQAKDRADLMAALTELKQQLGILIAHLP